MESGLEGRNNGEHIDVALARYLGVSMESGLEGRNNGQGCVQQPRGMDVSMESGLEGRNNECRDRTGLESLNLVSMESGLEGRNN